VLDSGCGSGILALAAHRFGAAAVLGVDIDEQAVTSSRYNAENNRCTVDFALPDGDPGGRFDLVVANILSNPLMLMAPMLSSRVAPGGNLVLSGVLERQADDVIAAYQPWLALEVWRSDEGWVCLHGRAAG
jgi:ribosomal protein L11 methyltransferase